VRNTLKDLRAAKGWSQAALGDELNVSRQTVNAIETGRYDPSLPLARRFINAEGRWHQKKWRPKKRPLNNVLIF